MLKHLQAKADDENALCDLLELHLLSRRWLNQRGIRKRNIFVKPHWSVRVNLMVRRISLCDHRCADAMLTTGSRIPLAHYSEAKHWKTQFDPLSPKRLSSSWRRPKIWPMEPRRNPACCSRMLLSLVVIKRRNTDETKPWVTFEIKPIS